MKKNGGASGIRGGLTTGLGELARGRVDPGLAFSLSFSFFLFFFFLAFSLSLRSLHVRVCLLLSWVPTPGVWSLLGDSRPRWWVPPPSRSQTWLSSYPDGHLCSHRTLTKSDIFSL